MWSFLGLLTVLQNILPSQLLSLLHSIYESLQDLFSPYTYFEIPEFNGYCGVDINDLYHHVNLYLNSIDPSATCRRLTLTRSKASTRITFTVAPNHTVHDSFNSHRLSWTHHVDTVQDSLDEKRSFSLKLPKRFRQTVLTSYLDFVSARAQVFERVSRERRLYTNNGHGSYESGWVSVPFRHPSTLDTLALEPGLKEQLTQDLTAFANGKEFYHRIGRSWKRGYLLYGPPGSGKSSLIAAMANFLCYDVYDLELTKVSDNSELRALLIQTSNRSIIVIEDIDCSLDLTTDRLSKSKKSKSSHTHSNGSDRREETGQVTLSGLLNFTDGLWSCCGEERIIVFTTNHRDNVDPALVRSGRMDVHVRLGTCGIHAFKALVLNYLGLESHELFDMVESCIRSGGALTPAEIGEMLLRNKRDVDMAMRAVVTALQASMLRVDRDLTDQDTDDFVRIPEVIDRLVLSSPEAYDSSPGKKKKMKFLEYAKSPNPVEALKLFSKLRGMGISPDKFTYPFVVKACGSCSLIGEGRAVHCMTVKAGFVSDHYVGNTLLNMYAVCAEIGLSRLVFDEMPERDVVSWSSLIGGLINCNREREAIAVFRQMNVANVKPNSITLVSLLCASNQLGCLEMGKSIHSHVIVNDIELDVSLGTALLDMYSQCGEIDNAIQVFCSMSEKNLKTWTVMICSLAYHGRGDDAISLFAQMEKDGFKPDSVSFTAILSACSHSCLVRDGNKYFDRMVNVYNISPTMEHYGCMVDLFGRVGMVEDAYEIIRNMPTDPNSVILRSFLSACRIHGKIIQLNKNLTKLLLEIQPSLGANYVLAANVSAVSGQWDDEAKLRISMKEKGLKKSPGCSWVV
ncbi:Pentatricopeptide repeat-containing protein [Thalictrum thalictroides]|uniref:Pentatricopeptide repeat-containing protein n=1 Tax=Thalictrum thalictroides TaxID=46969 RepID=A0A7J6UZY4_THATH|nr:Pentatricopeptide repeat-containing protein [Thalictrum thalictroides]